MESTIKDLIQRRSCKKFRNEMPPLELVETIMDAGTYAPNGMSRQSPIIICITNKEVRQTLSRLNARVLGTKLDPFYNAPIILAVLANKNINTCVEDGSLCIGNMLNAAHALGLGACWIHRAKEVFKMEEGAKILEDLHIEDEYVGIGHVALGYWDMEIPKPKERKSNYIYYVD